MYSAHSLFRLIVRWIRLSNSLPVRKWTHFYHYPAKILVVVVTVIREQRAVATNPSHFDLKKLSCSNNLSFVWDKCYCHLTLSSPLTEPNSTYHQIFLPHGIVESPNYVRRKKNLTRDIDSRQQGHSFHQYVNGKVSFLNQVIERSPHALTWLQPGILWIWLSCPIGLQL